jgi:NAD-dependent SIR2 family protein deacetylase
MESRWIGSSESDLSQLSELVSILRDLRVAVLTGAGCSTESGIPDYRGPVTRRRERDPILYGQFVGDEAVRRRYWARSMVGWPRMRAARPNAAHRHLARLERDGAIRGIITQNVDRLHGAAGSRRVVELHGALAEVRCLSCPERIERDALQEELVRRNPAWAEQHAAELAPDGDADLPEAVPADFDVPACTCGGILKPDVVFFGENVPRERTDAAWCLLDESDALLVVGSSLTVYSGYRFVRRAADERKPIGIINLGDTRGDEEAWVRVEARASEALGALRDALS